MKKSDYDCLIIGGSHAGLSAGMALGRLQRTVLIADTSQARNKVSKHANNLIAMDGIDPNRWRQQAKNDLKKYKTISFVQDRVVKIEKSNLIFKAHFESGKTVHSRKVILAYGIKDKLPEVPGIKELWGKYVFHCPYCHGFELKNQSLGIIGNGPFVEHMLPMIKNLSDKIILFTQGKAMFSESFLAQLKKHHIEVVEQNIIKFNLKNKRLISVKLTDKKDVSIDSLFVTPILPLQMNSNIADMLGCEKTNLGFIQTNEKGETSVNGVFAAGDIMNMQHSVAGAVATGQMAGSGAALSLSEEDFFKI